VNEFRFVLGWYKLFFIGMLTSIHGRIYPVYDMTKGYVTGNFIVPKSDVCYDRRKSHYVFLRMIFGVRDKAMTYCKIEGGLQTSIYDVIETNKSSRIELSLKNGIKLPLKNTGVVITRDVYASPVTSNGVILRIISYLGTNKYRAVKTPELQYNMWRSCTLRFNLFYNLLILIMTPGPRAIGFKHVYDPLDGVITKGSGTTRLQPITFPFHPLTHSVRDFNTLHFYFHPFDGSLLHFVPSPTKLANMKEDLTSVDIYKVAIT
jgi:hypothetical protein